MSIPVKGRSIDFPGAGEQKGRVLDLPRLQRISLSPKPRGQKFVANACLWPNYALLPGVDIRLEGLEHLPAGPVIFAMNHTDRYNYWPFQFQLYKKAGRFTATWVKGKYYENEAVGRFLEWMNNIPAASRGYVITRDFVETVGRKPTDAEYEVLRRWVERVERRYAERGSAKPRSSSVPPPPDGAIPDALLTKARNMLGRPFEPMKEDYAHAVDALFRAMTQRFVALNKEAIDLGLDLLVFPQGTRSVRLSRGHIGLSQIALRYKSTVVPVGCSGSDHVYPGTSPWAKRGAITYRIGAPIPHEEMRPFHIDEDYEPFSPEAEVKHREHFQGLTDLVMERINGLVDEPYKFASHLGSDGVQGSDRFL